MSTLERTTQARLASKGMSAVKLIPLTTMRAHEADATRDHPMTLNKKQMIREVGRLTRLKNHDVQAMLEALIDVWTEELVEGS
ncbi:MAG: hypothetical protein SF123_09100 [Chloroflexota bacterium]|nr:hypothetical protein [Chloroflexota bacterium]